MPHFLFGPITDTIFTDRFLTTPVAAGNWTTFSATCSSWDMAVAGGPPPDALLLWPGYGSVPAWVWSARVPVIALAHDSNLLWHGFKHLLPLTDLVLTDKPSADRLRRAGLDHIRAANLFGLDHHFLAELGTTEGDRPLDVVFAGNLSPATQAERMPWLGRLAKLASRWNVRIATSVFGADYRALLRQAKLVFNHSIRGECNLRAFEAAASGAVLLQEENNVEVRDYLEPGTEYAEYNADNFEAVVERLLADHEARRSMAARAKERVRGSSFATLVEAAVGVKGSDWEQVKERATRRQAAPPKLSLSGRAWQKASLNGPDADPQLATELAAANQWHALATVVKTTAAAESHLASAAKTNRVSAVGLGATLIALGQRDQAVEVLRRVLAELDANPVLSPEERDSVPFPVRFDHLRCGWERAGFDHPDRPEAESAAKWNLLRCRAAALLSEQTDELAAYQRAVEACPHIPPARAALGCALGRARRFAEAVPHLRFAVDHDPFDLRAARALEVVLAQNDDPAAVSALRDERALLARAAPGLVGEAHPAPPARSEQPTTRFAEISTAAFAARFGTLDTTRAISDFTPPHDTAAVLTLLTHFQPRRVLEIGTATGQMTANLTAFTPPDATVFSLGIVAEDGPQSGTDAQHYEIPTRQAFAKHLNHFGTAHKAQLITTDSRTFDFGRLGTLDFVFVDGGHDFRTVCEDSLHAYQALRTGGCLVWHDLPSAVAWVEVQKAVASLNFPETVSLVAGTQVAFLIKGEGLGTRSGPHNALVALAWDGEFEAVHSLAAVNRAVCSELIERGHDVALVRSPSRTLGATPFPLAAELSERFDRELPGAVTVRHRWPPDFRVPPGDGPFVLMQPWEFGRIPRAWIEPILATVDEVWAYSRSVLRTYTASGIPEERIALVPPGVDTELFRPGLDPLPLPTTKTVKLLFVGGTIPRKGFDVLLAAYGRAFTNRDDVCLVVKDMGANSFYRDQTAGVLVEKFRANPNAPEVVYLTDDLSESDLARLYAACDALVHPYRGEGFALPVLEAMATGKPVVATAGGPTDEFAPPSVGWKIPATLRYFPEERVGDMPTSGHPWWLEPDSDALVQILHEVAANAGLREKCGRAARRAALGWTWAKTASAIEDRVRVLRTRTPVRFRKHSTPTKPTPVSLPQGVPGVGVPLTVRSDAPIVVPSEERTAIRVPAVAHGKPVTALTMIVKNEEENLPDCLASVRDLVDKMFIVDTGSTDRTREIARSFGAVVGEFPWVNHFARARNAALDLAKGDYAFWMDADDRIDEPNRVKLKKLLDGLKGENDAYVMKCLCVPDKPGADATVVDHVRLFRLVPEHRWTFRVHEQILPALRATDADVHWADVTINHVGYVDPAVRKRKLARDLGYLRMDVDENPDCPFTLFNLGCVYRELGDHQAALRVLEKSLALSAPRASIVRKLYASISHLRGGMGDGAGAARALAEGREQYPEDAELLFLAGNLAKEHRRYADAEQHYRQLIEGTDGNHFASVDAGLRTVRGRHNLAILLMELGRHAEAEGLWRAALVADPHFLQAHLGLGEIYLKTGNEAGIGGVVRALRELSPEHAAEGVALAARWRMSQKDYGGAVSMLEEGMREFPGAVCLRITRSHVRLADGSPPDVLEAAFRAILALDPENEQAVHNLRVLRFRMGSGILGVIDPTSSPE